MIVRFLFYGLEIVFLNLPPKVRLDIPILLTKFVINVLKIRFINYVDLFNCSQELGPSTSSITMYTTYPEGSQPKKTW